MSLCRGEVRKQTRKELKKMKCWYRHGDPLLVIKPAKVERVWFNPEVFMIRDAVSDRQIEFIKETANAKVSDGNFI